MKNLKISLKNILLSLVICFLTIIVLSGQPNYSMGQQMDILAQKPYQFPLDQKLPKYLFDSDNEKKWIEHINEELKNYSSDIVESKGNLIMLRYPRDWYKIIRLTPVVTKVSKENSLFLITFADKSLIRICMVIIANTDESLRTTIASAAKHILTSSRFSTWGRRGLKQAGPNFERVNFVSYYYPLDYANIYYVSSQNIFIIIFSEDYLTGKKDEQHPHVRWQTVEQLVNSVTSVFAEPEANRAFKKSDDLILNMYATDKWSQKKKGYCEFEWEVKGELKDYWVVVRSAYGILSIISPDKTLYDPELAKTRKFEDTSHVHKGIFAISDMPNKKNLLTMYAITPDGKTWYRRQIKIDPKEQFLPPVNYPYRRWESSNGRYWIMAKLVSISGIDDIEADKITLDILKNKIFTIEKQATKELIKFRIGDMSKQDQEYLLKQIKSQ
ncbi:MAG: hypothetical protein LBH59_01660 [Planctomycetaceae bacterium]|jgi:hypothetical protein|nr:hypothetical protein [Planctomycetaceae bacterium]